MTVLQILAHLRDRGVRVWIDGERVRYRGPRAALTEGLRAQLLEREAEIRAALVQAQAWTGEGRGPERIRRVTRGRAPLSFGQERLWFLHQLDPESAAYNVPAAVEATGSLDRTVLAAALAGVVARHEVLRTGFESSGGVPEAVARPPLPLPLPVIDLGHLASARAQREALRLGLVEVRRPFDLARPPLVRARLLAFGTTRHLLLLTVHHAVFDGWSLGVFLSDLSRAYSAGVQGAGTDLPPLEIQYGDFAAWQRRWLSGEALERQLGYWRDRLAGAPPTLGLPLDRSRRRRAQARGARLPVALRAELSERLGEARAAAPGEPVHGPARALSGSSGAARSEPGPVRRNAGGQPAAAGDRSAGGLLRQHPGAPRRPDG